MSSNLTHAVRSGSDGQLFRGKCVVALPVCIRKLPQEPVLVLAVRLHTATADIPLVHREVVAQNCEPVRCIHGCQMRAECRVTLSCGAELQAETSTFSAGNGIPPAQNAALGWEPWHFGHSSRS
jgi:hypothetical protein